MGLTSIVMPKSAGAIDYDLALDAGALGKGSGYTKEEKAQLKNLYGFTNGSSTYPFPDDLGPYSRYWWGAMRAATDAVPGLGPCAVRWLSKLLYSVVSALRRIRKRNGGEGGGGGGRGGGGGGRGAHCLKKKEE